MNQEQAMPLAIALSRTLGIPVASEDAEALEGRLTEMIQNAFAKGIEISRNECAAIAKQHSHRDDDMGAIIERAILAEASV